MGAHQVSYVVVAQRIRVQLVCAEDISFYTIRAKYNGPLEASDCHIAGVAYDWDAGCGARGPPKWGLIRSAM